MPAVEQPTSMTTPVPAPNVVKTAEDAPSGAEAVEPPPALPAAANAQTTNSAPETSAEPAQPGATEETAPAAPSVASAVPSQPLVPTDPVPTTEPVASAEPVAPTVTEPVAPPKRAPGPPPGGVRFGNVEIVAPSEPVAPPLADPAVLEEDDPTDKDFQVDDAAQGEDDEAEDGEVDLGAVQIPGGMPELPRGLLSQLLANGSLGNKVLHKAAAEGDVAELRKLLAENGEMKGLINDLDMFSYTPLHIAAENGNLEVCKVLIELKADVKACTKMYSSTALHYGRDLHSLLCVAASS